MVVSESEFKGHKMISLKRNEDDLYSFMFGVKKAQLILENIDAIKFFVEKNKKELTS